LKSRASCESALSIMPLIYCNSLNVLKLVRRIPIHGFCFFAADRTEHLCVADLISPILKENLKVGLARIGRASSIKITVIVYRYLNWNQDSSTTPFNLFQLSKDVIEH